MKLNAKALLSRWRIVFLLGVVLVAGGVKAYELTHNRGYQPDQPIFYSHKLHAGQLGIDCLYCHTNAERSRHATVPGVDTCMGCHATVRTDRPEIQKLTEYYNNNQPVPWVRVHSLPDHVYFPHDAHVNAGVACQTCHGNIQEMEIVYQAVDLSMGWCMTCHRGDNYLRTPERLATQASKNQFAHSYYHLPEGKKATDAELQKQYADFTSLNAEYWNVRDLDNAANQAASNQQLHQMIEATIGYDSYARQQGDRGRGVVTNHVLAFQNAGIDCNTCHF